MEYIEIHKLGVYKKRNGFYARVIWLNPFIVINYQHGKESVCTFYSKDGHFRYDGHISHEQQLIEYCGDTIPEVISPLKYTYYECRDGQYVKIIFKMYGNPYPWIAVSSNNKAYFYDDDGKNSVGEEYDLLKETSVRF